MVLGRGKFRKRTYVRFLDLTAGGKCRKKRYQKSAWLPIIENLSRIPPSIFRYTKIQIFGFKFNDCFRFLLKRTYVL